MWAQCVYISSTCWQPAATACPWGPCWANSTPSRPVTSAASVTLWRKPWSTETPVSSAASWWCSRSVRGAAGDSFAESDSAISSDSEIPVVLSSVFLSGLCRWCLGFSILSQSRIGRVCVAQAFSCGSYWWLQWIRSEQRFNERCASPSGKSEIQHL